MPLKLHAKLALLSGVPIAGLVISITASSVMSRITTRAIARAKDQSAVHAVLGLAGDGLHATGGVEGAYLSGVALAARLTGSAPARE